MQDKFKEIKKENKVEEKDKNEKSDAEKQEEYEKELLERIEFESAFNDAVIDFFNENSKSK